MAKTYTTKIGELEVPDMRYTGTLDLAPLAGLERSVQNAIKRMFRQAVVEGIDAYCAETNQEVDVKAVQKVVQTSSGGTRVATASTLWYANGKGTKKMWAAAKAKAEKRGETLNFKRWESATYKRLDEDEKRKWQKKRDQLSKEKKALNAKKVEEDSDSEDESGSEVDVDSESEAELNLNSSDSEDEMPTPKRRKAPAKKTSANKKAPAKKNSTNKKAPAKKAPAKKAPAKKTSAKKKARK